MNLDRIKQQATAGVILTAAGVLLLIALGLFLYWQLKAWMDPAAAAGLSFLAFAVVLGIAGLGMRARGASHHPSHARPAAGGGGLPERAMDLARARPIAALAIGAVIVVVALRNPALIAALAGAALNRPPPARR